MKNGEIVIGRVAGKTAAIPVTKSLKIDPEKVLQPESIHSSEINELDVPIIKTQEDSISVYHHFVQPDCRFGVRRGK